MEEEEEEGAEGERVLHGQLGPRGILEVRRSRFLEALLAR